MTHDTDALISGLVEDLHPVRPLRFSRGMALAAATAVVALVLVALLVPIRADVAAAQPSGMFMVSSGLFLLLGVACAAAVVLMASPRVGNGHEGWGWALAMASLLPLSAIVLAFANGPAAWAASDPVHGVNCLAASTGLGLLTGGALVLWLRRGAPTSPERAGLLTGIAAGCAGVFAFSFACPIDSIMHIGLWHGLVVTASAAIGRLVVPPLVRW